MVSKRGEVFWLVSAVVAGDSLTGIRKSDHRLEMAAAEKTGCSTGWPSLMGIGQKD
jgi:hypothetical protein